MNRQCSPIAASRYQCRAKLSLRDRKQTSSSQIEVEHEKSAEAEGPHLGAALCTSALLRVPLSQLIRNVKLSAAVARSSPRKR
jgi:hypothetical protein